MHPTNGCSGLVSVEPISHLHLSIQIIGSFTAHLYSNIGITFLLDRKNVKHISDGNSYHNAKTLEHKRNMGQVSASLEMNHLCQWIEKNYWGFGLQYSEFQTLDETNDQDVGIGTHIFISILKLGWYCPMTMNLNYPIPTVQHQNQFRPDTDKNGVHVISFTWLIVPEDHISFFRNKPKGFASH